MTNPNFKRFFEEVILPAQASVDEAFEKIPLPASISEEAKLFLTNDKGPSAPINIEDPTVREMARQMICAMWQSAEKYLNIEYSARNEPIAGVACRVFTPKNLQNTKQKIVYLHGGAYWLGSAKANSSIAINLADKMGVEVVSVDYRLAPEHPYPAAKDDTLSVYKALLASGTAPGNIALVGDSAGGGLALSATIEIIEQNIPKPAALGLIAPWTDLTFSGDSHLTNNMHADTRLSVEGLKAPAKAYAGHLNPEDPKVSPLFAELTGLPPTLIQVGSREIFLSDATRLTSAALSAGVEVHLDIYEAMWHVWHFYPHLPEGTQAIKEIAKHLSKNMI